MLKKILIGLAAVIVIFVIFVAMQPADFRIARTATMAGPPAAAFAQVNDFHKMMAWSPYMSLDPNAKVTYEGAAAGKGAIFTWNSQKNDVGQGRMEITTSQPSSLIQIQLDFVRPFKANNVAEFTFKPVGKNTEVTWAMIGKKNFISKAFCLFMDMDKMVGGDFEKGLASMKKIAEATKESTQ